ncbi:MAG: hypothetical protein HC851_15840 [Acaryochloris sp. RU_4_1]|nr:hypothetical protein [Acaryochloris sp. RU_4_1]NJR56054.1 hypothetical protein [Acaryochloris sp. CRU_2_0]
MNQESTRINLGWEPTGIKPFGTTSQPKFSLKSFTDTQTDQLHPSFQFCFSIPKRSQSTSLGLSLSQADSVWLAYRIGALKANWPGDGCDLLRSIEAVYSDLSLDPAIWPLLESAILQDDFASGIPPEVVYNRAITEIAGQTNPTFQ